MEGSTVEQGAAHASAEAEAARHRVSASVLAKEMSSTEFLDAVGVRRAVVLGHSSAGYVAQRFLDALPVTGPDLDRVPDDRERAMSEAFRLEIIYDKPTHTARCRTHPDRRHSARRDRNGDRR